MVTSGRQLIAEWVRIQRVAGRKQVIRVAPSHETGAPAAFCPALVKAMYLQVTDMKLAGENERSEPVVGLRVPWDAGGDVGWTPGAGRASLHVPPARPVRVASLPSCPAVGPAPSGLQRLPTLMAGGPRS